MLPINLDTLEFIRKRLLPGWGNLSARVTRESVAFRIDRDDLKRSAEVCYPMTAWTESEHDFQTSALLVVEHLNQLIRDNQHR